MAHCAESSVAAGRLANHPRARFDTAAESIVGRRRTERGGPIVMKALVVVAALVLGGLTAAIPARAQEATPPAGAQASPVDVAIELGEFFISPEPTMLLAGQPYRFVVTNTGLAKHELVIEPAGAKDEPLEKDGMESEVEDVATGETKEFTWIFAEPGEYQFACYVADHYKHGMLVPFTVVPAGTQVVKVALDDFSVTPDTTALETNTPYLFEVTNAGAATHEFVIEPRDAVDEPLEIEAEGGEERESEIEDIAPGETRTLLWTFTEAGDYDMACHLPGHYEAGMKTGFTATA
jgi:uncharacterized cupredoxin-like copper-binding protein